MAPWVKSGKIKYTETVMDGFEQLPKCMIGTRSTLSERRSVC